MTASHDILQITLKRNSWNVWINDNAKTHFALVIEKAYGISMKVLKRCHVDFQQCRFINASTKRILKFTHCSLFTHIDIHTLPAVCVAEISLFRSKFKMANSSAEFSRICLRKCLHFFGLFQIQCGKNASIFESKYGKIRLKCWPILNDFLEIEMDYGNFHHV